jgi:hypothetical protein
VPETSADNIVATWIVPSSVLMVTRACFVGDIQRLNVGDMKRMIMEPRDRKHLRFLTSEANMQLFDQQQKECKETFMSYKVGRYGVIGHDVVYVSSLYSMNDQLRVTDLRGINFCRNYYHMDIQMLRELNPQAMLVYNPCLFDDSVQYTVKQLHAMLPTSVMMTRSVSMVQAIYSSSNKSNDHFINISTAKLSNQIQSTRRRKLTRYAATADFSASEAEVEDDVAMETEADKHSRCFIAGMSLAEGLDEHGIW